jgi:hypothetical protein
MRSNDQYFVPGDKVMRVSCGDFKGVDYAGKYKIPGYGETFCVEDFWEGPCFNVIMLVGFGGWRYNPLDGTPVGWQSSAFRKVEEIKLCLSALEKKKQKQVVHKVEPITDDL